MAKYFDISFIGSGNVASHLAKAMENAGHFVHEIYSRNPENAKALIGKLYNTAAQEHLDFSRSKARIFFLAASDNAIPELAAEIILPPNALLVHTSGSVPLSQLGYASDRIGVFYPLQTFSKSKKIDLREVPILIEAEDKKVEKELWSLARTLSRKIEKVNSNNRKIIHIAAVFACNFTNHLLAISNDMLEKQKVDFELLKPLIVETINKGLSIGPENAQTGPAVRNDLQTLDNHMAYLEYDESLQEIYKVISQHIIDSNYSDK